MAQSQDHLSDLERHIQILEEKTVNLRASLSHWQKWYLEYSSLHEEVSSLPSDPQPRKELARLRRDFESDILSKREINEIFGKNDLRERDQVLSILSRRVDYVEQNITSLEKLLEAEENKLAAATVIAHPDAGVDEETGLPITDIVERIDEDGNVIDFTLQSGGDIEPKILEALKKAGIDDLAPERGNQEKSTDGPPEIEEQSGPRPRSQPKAPKEVLVPDDSGDEQATIRKSVSFAADTKPGHDSHASQRSDATRQLEKIMQTAKEQEAMDLSTAVLPSDETEDERELRRQMLQYGMSEIGPVVAELELEEGGSDEELSYDETDEEDSEDDLGRSKTSVITDDYIQRMKELEKRLGVQSAFTATPHRPKSTLPEEGIGRISVRQEPNSTGEDPAPKGKGKKSVKFDISEEKHPADSKADVNPLSDVLERTSHSQNHPATEAPAGKPPSRFKKERGTPAGGLSAQNLPQGPHQIPARFREAEGNPPPLVPTGPEGETIAKSVVEREVSMLPRNPDQFDNQLLQQAANVEYHRLRNRMIQREGGFMKEEESPISQVDNEEEAPQRVSRFKAARLSQRN